MAAGNAGRKNQKNLWLIFFWVLFFLVIILLFVINWPTIHDNLASIGLLHETGTEAAAPKPKGKAPEKTPPVSVQPPPSSHEAPGEASGGTPGQPASGQSETQASNQNTGGAQGEQTPAAASSEAPSQAPSPASEETSNEVPRSLYFVKVDDDGAIVRSPVKRALPVSASPLQQVLTALFHGPTAAEKAQGYRSLIPPASSLISVSMNGSIAVVNISEDFRFNSYSQEGYMWSVRQIVWTATEFPTVTQVQILIDGKSVNYLGEGIWISGPLSRDSP
jgi:spore germination protein GerM